MVVETHRLRAPAVLSLPVARERHEARLAVLAESPNPARDFIPVDLRQAYVQ